MSRVLCGNIPKKILLAFRRGVRGTSHSDFNVVNLILLIAFSLELPIIFWRALLSLILLYAHKHYLRLLLRLLLLDLKVFLIWVSGFPLFFEAVDSNAANHGNKDPSE